MSSHSDAGREEPPAARCLRSHDQLAVELELHTREPSDSAREARFRAANHPDSCCHVLSLLLGADDRHLVRRLAEHPSLSFEDMRSLCFHHDCEVRSALAGNCRVPGEICRHLVNDENPDVRYALAENYQIDQAILSALLEDENPFVAARARQTLRRLNVHLCVAVPLPGGAVPGLRANERRSG